MERKERTDWTGKNEEIKQTSGSDNGGEQGTLRGIFFDFSKLV